MAKGVPASRDCKEAEDGEECRSGRVKGRPKNVGSKARAGDVGGVGAEIREERDPQSQIREMLHLG